MESYNFDSNGRLTFTSSPAVSPKDETEVKIRITNAGLTERDLLLSEGKPLTENLIPCSCAVGVVSETFDECELKKGDRVVVSPFVACETCQSCSSTDNCQKFSLLGENDNGFLRDFAVVPKSNVFALPDSVSDETALFVSKIALGLAAIDKLELQKGNYIYVGDGGALANVICNLAIYYQSIPILIGSKQASLDLAKKLGIYYTVQETGEEAKRLITQITGGKMASRAIVTDSRVVDFERIEGLLNVGSSVALTRSGEISGEISLSALYEKDLTLFAVKNANRFVTRAINLLATKSIDVAPLIRKSASFDKVNELFLDMRNAEDNNQPVFMNVVNILKM